MVCTRRDLVCYGILVLVAMFTGLGVSALSEGEDFEADRGVAFRSGRDKR